MQPQRVSDGGVDVMRPLYLQLKQMLPPPPIPPSRMTFRCLRGAPNSNSLKVESREMEWGMGRCDGEGKITVPYRLSESIDLGELICFLNCTCFCCTMQNKSTPAVWTLVHTYCLPESETETLSRLVKTVRRRNDCDGGGRGGERYLKQNLAVLSHSF